MTTLRTALRTVQRDLDRIQHVIHMLEITNQLIRKVMRTHLRLHHWLEEQPLRDGESLERLAERGWLLGPRMPVAAIPQLSSLLNDAPDEVDIVVAQHVRRHLNSIEAELIESYPHRSHLFQEAFWAHRHGKYVLSVPVLLEQADGIFYDRFGSLLFSKRRKDEVVAFSSEVRGRFFEAALHPLKGDVPLWMDTRSLDDTFEGLNRHHVIHGMKVYYNTELNSLKSIALLDYLCWVLNRPTNQC